MAKTKASPGPLLNVLALHGGYQNDDIFYKKTGALRRLLKSGVRLHYVCAPHRATDEEMLSRGMTPRSEEGPVYKWWTVPEGQWRVSTAYHGMDETLDVIKKAFREQGPFDGILGFSQGGVLAAMLCGLNTPQPTPDNPVSFRFAIIAAAFPPTGQPYRQLLEERVGELCPTLHLLGDQDNVVTAEASEQLVALFPTAVIVRHSRGHTVPVDSQTKASYTHFLSQFTP